MKCEYSAVTGRPMKPCKKGYVRNPETNRCRKKKSASALRPKAKRKTKPTAKLTVTPKPKAKPRAKAGAKPKAKPKAKAKPGAKPKVRKQHLAKGQAKMWCELTQLQARRLILTVGLGRDLETKDLPTAKNPNKLCDTLTGMLSAKCVKGWKVTKFIAAGAYGHVFRVVKSNGKKAVMKVQVGSAKEIKHEVTTQKQFGRKGLAPKILEYCSFKPRDRLGKSAHNRLNALVQDEEDGDVEPHKKGHMVHIIVMEEIAGVVGDWLKLLKSKEQLGQLSLNILTLVEAFKKHKLTHADLHLWNLGYVYTDSSKKYIRLMPIDFGRSVVGESNPELEIGAILRTLQASFSEKVPEFNRRVIANLLRALSPRRFGISFPGKLSDASDRFVELLTIHMEKHGFW